MIVHVVVDWDNEEVLCVYKDKESAETHVENECDESDNVTIDEMTVEGGDDE